MKRYLFKAKFLLVLLCLVCGLTGYGAVASAEKRQVTDFPWAVMAYWGRMTNDDLLPVVAFQYSLNPETLYSGEISYQLAADNPLRLFLQPLLTTVEVVANFTYRDDPAYPIYEFNPYIAFRWSNFPWQKYVYTTFALGEGVSYDSKIPSIELNNPDQVGQRLLNFIMLEITFALPDYPQLELVGRIHHRSGVFGLYNAENNGSTAIGVGMRYRF